MFSLIKLDMDEYVRITNYFKVLSLESLVSEIGGSLGLFLGFSFLTLWDAIEFLLGKLSIFFNKKVH